MNNLLERFNEKVDKSGECWTWIGAKYSNGYGVMMSNIIGVNTGAHRISLELFKGEIPDGLFVLHSCDNRSCVNPDHLFLGTLQDNHDDMIKKGRQPRGESHVNSVLTVEQVLKIREMCGEYTHKQIASMFGICRTTITKIVNRTAWKHV